LELRQQIDDGSMSLRANQQEQKFETMAAKTTGTVAASKGQDVRVLRSTAGGIGEVEAPGEDPGEAPGALKEQLAAEDGGDISDDEVPGVASIFSSLFPSSSANSSSRLQIPSFCISVSVF